MMSRALDQKHLQKYRWIIAILAGALLSVKTYETSLKHKTFSVSVKKSQDYRERSVVVFQYIHCLQNLCET